MRNILTECKDNRSFLFPSLYLFIIFKTSTHIAFRVRNKYVKEKETKSYHGLHMAWHCHLEGLGSCYY